MILAIETSAKTFSAAVSRDKELLGEVFFNSGFVHSQKLLPSIRFLLKNLSVSLSDLKKIAVSTGPGSFTGIRVGLACAKTLSQNLKIPVAAVDVFDILTNSVSANKYPVFPIIDALRQEVFVKINGKVSIIDIKTLAKNLEKKKFVLAGNGVLKYGSEIVNALKNENIVFSDTYYPRAGVLAVMAEGIKGTNYKNIEPLYIRKSWAEENK